MRRISLGALTAALVASLVIGGSATGAAQVAGLYTRWLFDEGNGALAFVRFAGSSDARVMVGASGLLASQEYLMVGRMIGCDGTPAASNRVFSVGGTTDDEGSLWIDQQSVDTLGVTRSMWLKPVGAGPAVCGASFNFDTLDFAGATDADAVLGTLPNKHVLALIERRPDGIARFSMFHGAFEDAFILRSNMVNKPCGHYPTKVFESIDIGGASMNVFRWREGPVSQQKLNGTRSLRLRDIPAGTRLGCVPMQQFAFRDV